MKVLVYGTLKRGFFNNPWILESGGKYIEDVYIEIPDVSMYELHGNYPFPALIETGETTPFHAELWKVEHLDYLDRLESYPEFYDRCKVEFEGITAWIYYCPISNLLHDDFKSFSPLQNWEHLTNV